MSRRLAAVLASLVLSGATVFMPPPTGAQERFSERIAVTEVEVPVRVLVKGRPVAGLTRDDFVLLDRGQPQEILGFRVRAIPGREDIAVLPGEEAAAAPDGTSTRKLMLLFDFSFARRNRLAAAVEDLSESLFASLSAGDEVAVATYGGLSGLNLLVGFTRDREKVALALEAIDAMLDANDRRQREALRSLHDLRFGDERAASTFEALSRELGRTAALAVLAGPVTYDEAEDDGVEIEEQSSFGGPIKVRVEVDVTEPVRTAQDGGSDLRAFGLSLTELAYLLRDTGGRKELLMVSEGFAGDVLREPRNLFYMEKALRAFRDSGWTVHGVDVGGVAGLGEASFDGDSLLYLADGTGGEIIENMNDYGAAAERVLARTEIAYVLTFQPSLDGDPGEFRKLQVKLAERLRGAKLAHRPGYYLRRPPARREILERRVDAAEWLLSNVEADELDVALYGEVEIDPEGGGVRVPLVVEVGGASLRGPTRRSTRVEMQAIALDEAGRVAALLSAESLVRRRGSATAGAALDGTGGVRFTGDLLVPTGSYRIRLVLRSHREGQVFLRSFPLRVSADPAADSGLEPPPPDRAEGWITVAADLKASYFR